MIVNDGMKREAFLHKISLHLTGDARFGWEQTASGDRPLIYFGAGYWRGFEETFSTFPDNTKAIRLVNPDVPHPADIATVEQALCILKCGVYKPT
jgi:hypothetical protein